MHPKQKLQMNHEKLAHGTKEKTALEGIRYIWGSGHTRSEPANTPISNLSPFLEEIQITLNSKTSAHLWLFECRLVSSLKS